MVEHRMFFGDIVMLLANLLRLYSEAPDEVVIKKNKGGGYYVTYRFYEKE